MKIEIQFTYVEDYAPNKGDAGFRAFCDDFYVTNGGSGKSPIDAAIDLLTRVRDGRKGHE